MKALVDTYSKPEDTVIDLCAGTGTTSTAAALLGRNAIAMEINPKLAATIIPRVQQAMAENPAVESSSESDDDDRVFR